MTSPRFAVEYVEIDVDYCALEYGATNGAGVCPAVLGEDSEAKCFQTLKTCPVIASFINAPVTLRFAVPTNDLPREIECDPCIKAPVDFDPATISLGENLGQRATLKVNFVDHPDTDTGPGGDKYRTERGYDPWLRGTFFGKMRARQPYLRGRSIRRITGFLPASFAAEYPIGSPLPDGVLDEQQTRHYVIDSFTGPTPAAAIYTVVAKDVLKLADGDRALAPRPSDGFLAADISSGATSANLSSGSGSEYPTPGNWVAIAGKEICSYTRVVDALTLTRGQLGTTAVALSAQDRVQLVLRYVSADPADIIYDLLVNYADVPAGYIDLDEWRAETETHLDRLYTATIPNPTSVATLLSELIQQAALALWWDDQRQKIGLQVLRGINTSAAVFNESNMIAGTLSIDEQPDKRISQIRTLFAQINPLTNLTDEANFRSQAFLHDEDVETFYGSAAIKTIYSRWIPAGGRAIADRCNDLQMARYKHPPRKFKFQVLRGSVDPEPEQARGFGIEAWTIQDETGAAVPAPIEVTRVKPDADVMAVEAEEMLWEAPPDEGTRVVSFDFDVYNVNLRSAYDSLYGEPEDGDEIIAVINTGVSVGSVSTSLAAFVVGDWPEGVNITLDVRGNIDGAAGAGGRSGYPGSFLAANGGSGGTALYTRRAITLKYTTGKVRGGGGGGGGGGSAATNSGGLPAFPIVTGGGGSGGQGRNGGAAGSSAGGDYPGNNGLAGSPLNPGSGTLGGQGSGVFAGNSGGGGNFGSVGQSGNNAPMDPFDFIVTAPGLGGAAGNSIDGVSFVTVDGTPGTIAGPQIN